jgi:hypothetical protein
VKNRSCSPPPHPAPSRPTRRPLADRSQTREFGNATRLGPLEDLRLSPCRTILGLAARQPSAEARRTPPQLLTASAAAPPPWVPRGWEAPAPGTGLNSSPRGCAQEARVASLGATWHGSESRAAGRSGPIDRPGSLSPGSSTAGTGGATHALTRTKVAYRRWPESRVSQ